MLASLRERISKEQCSPTWVSIFMNPAYIIRSKLRKHIYGFRNVVSGRVLDFGCGQKPYQHLFDDAYEYVGVDILESGHDHNDSRVDVFWDGKKLPFDNESFDNAVCFEVLEHLFDIEETLTELNRVLKSGGGLLVTTPFMYREHEAPFDSARYTTWGMKNLLSRTGFEVVDQEKTSGALGVVCQILVDSLGKYFVKFGHLGFWAFIPFLTVLNLIGSIPISRRNAISSDTFLNLVTYAKKV